jgi:hypothetical protein
MPSSGMWRRVDHVWIDSSEKHIFYIFRKKSAREEQAWAGGRTSCFIMVHVQKTKPQNSDRRSTLPTFMVRSSLCKCSIHFVSCRMQWTPIAQLPSRQNMVLKDLLRDSVGERNIIRAFSPFLTLRDLPECRFKYFTAYLGRAMQSWNG